MNIQPVYTSVDASPVTAIAAPAPSSTGAVTQAESRVGPAATWWISPPGQFFSVLHQVAEAYPVELKAAILALVHAPTGAAMSVIANEVAHTTQPAYRRATYGAPQQVSTPAAAPPSETREAPAVASPVDALLATMHRLASESPTDFRTMATEVASSFESVSSAVQGLGSEAMRTLAMQLQQSAEMGAPMSPPMPQWQRAGPEPIPSIPPMAAIEGEAPFVEEAPSWMRTPSAAPSAGTP